MLSIWPVKGTRGAGSGRMGRDEWTSWGDHFHSPGSWTFGLKGNKKILSFGGKCPNSSSDSGEERKETECILSPPPGYWSGTADSRPLPSTVGVWGEETGRIGENRCQAISLRPVVSVAATSATFGASWERTVWEIAQFGGDWAGEPHNDDGEKVLNLTACQNCTAGLSK